MSRAREIFAEEYDHLTGFVRKLFGSGGAVDAEDIVQDVFLATLNAESVSPIDDTLAYIYRSIKNRIIDLRRKKGGDTLSTDALDENGIALADKLTDERSGVESVFHDAQCREQLFAALDRLSDIERRIIIENEFEGRSFAELSKQTGIAIGTLLSKKSRAMKKLALYLQNGEYDETDTEEY